MSQDISSGIVSAFADGEVINAKAEVKYDLSLVVVEVSRGVNGHYSEKHVPKAPMISMKISDQGKLAQSALAGKRYDVIQVALLNGKVIKLNKAVITGDIEVDADEGEMTVVYTGTADPDEETTG